MNRRRCCGTYLGVEYRSGFNGHLRNTLHDPDEGTRDRLCEAGLSRRMERTQMSDNYWQSLVGQRLSRRRALAVAGGGSAAAFLAACGGGSDSKSGSGKEQEAP